MDTNAIAPLIRTFHLEAKQLKADPMHLAETAELLLYVIDQNEDNCAFLAENRQWQYDLLRHCHELISNSSTEPRRHTDPHHSLTERQHKMVVANVMDLHWFSLYMALQGIWNGGHGSRQNIGAKIDSIATALVQGMDKAQTELPQPVTATNALLMRTQAMKIAKLAGMIDERRPLGDWSIQQNQALLELVNTSLEIVGYMLGALGYTFQAHAEKFLNRKPVIQE